MAVKKTKPKKAASNKSKKVEVVFQDSKSSNQNKKSSKVSNKPTGKKVEHKTEHKHVASKSVDHKHHTVHKKSTSKKTKDYVVIGILSVLIVALVILAFVVPTNGDVEDDTDIFKDINSTPQEPLETMDPEEFEKMALELNLKILTDMKDYQLNVLSEYYQELNLDSQEMESCLLDNEFYLKDSNLFDYDKISNIQNDFLQAQELQISSTPSIYVNGSLLSGFQDYNTFTSFIDSIDTSQEITLDYSDKSFEYTDDALKLYYVTNTQDQEIYQDNLDFVDFLKSSENLAEVVNDLFTSIFEQSEVEYVDYSSDLGKSILQTINASSLPALYLVGDVDSLTFESQDTKELLPYVFESEEINNGRFISKDIFTQLTFGSDFSQIFKLLDYSSLIKETDNVIGSSDADISIILFTDYDCPFCKQFEEETLTDTFFEEYIDSGKANLVIKPMVTNDIFSIMPILFLKCSEDQGASLEVHKKIFELNPVIGVQTVYDLVSVNYSEELEFLENEYNKIASSMEEN